MSYKSTYHLLLTTYYLLLTTKFETKSLLFDKINDK